MELVAEPMSRRSTEFCTAVTIVCMVNPRPAPNRYSKMATCQNGVSTSRRDRASRPTVMITAPSTG